MSNESGKTPKLYIVQPGADIPLPDISGYKDLHPDRNVAARDVLEEYKTNKALSIHQVVRLVRLARGIEHHAQSREDLDLAIASLKAANQAVALAIVKDPQIAMYTERRAKKAREEAAVAVHDAIVQAHQKYRRDLCYRHYSLQWENLPPLSPQAFESSVQLAKTAAEIAKIENKWASNHIGLSSDLEFAQLDDLKRPACLGMTPDEFKNAQIDEKRFAEEVGEFAKNAVYNPATLIYKHQIIEALNTCLPHLKGYDTGAALELARYCAEAVISASCYYGRTETLDHHGHMAITQFKEFNGDLYKNSKGSQLSIEDLHTAATNYAYAAKLITHFSRTLECACATEFDIKAKLRANLVHLAQRDPDGFQPFLTNVVGKYLLVNSPDYNALLKDLSAQGVTVPERNTPPYHGASAQPRAAFG